MIIIFYSKGNNFTGDKFISNKTINSSSKIYLLGTFCVKLFHARMNLIEGAGAAFTICIRYMEQCTSL